MLFYNSLLRHPKEILEDHAKFNISYTIEFLLLSNYDCEPEDVPPALKRI